MREPVSIEARAAHMTAIREKAEREMADIGVTAEFIDLLVETFYTRIRAHATLGPVFERKLEGKWEPHLVKMKRFWGSLAFKNGAYGGKPVAAHTPLLNQSPEMSPGLFGEWLQLFNATLIDIAPTPKAHDWFMTTADRIARSLVTALFYNPGDDDPARQRTDSTP